MWTADITYFIAESAAVDGSGYTRQLPAIAIYIYIYMCIYKGVDYYYYYSFRRSTASKDEFATTIAAHITHTHTHTHTHSHPLNVCSMVLKRSSTSGAAEGAETIRDDKIMNAPRRSPGT